MGRILAKDICTITNLKKYKLHLPYQDNNGVSPLDEYVTNTENWIGWDEWHGNKEDWTREYIFSLIEFYPKANFCYLEMKSHKIQISRGNL